VEVQIGMIAKGQADKDAVVAHTLQQFRQKFLFFVAKVARMDALFEASFSPLASSGEDIPFHSIPFHSIPFHSIPFHSIPFHSIPFHSIRCLLILFHFNSFCFISFHLMLFHVHFMSFSDSLNTALPLGSGTYSPEQLPV